MSLGVAHTPSTPLTLRACFFFRLVLFWSHPQKQPYTRWFDWVYPRPHLTCQGFFRLIFPVVRIPAFICLPDRQPPLNPEQVTGRASYHQRYALLFCLAALLRYSSRVFRVPVLLTIPVSLRVAWLILSFVAPTINTAHPGLHYWLYLFTVSLLPTIDRRLDLATGLFIPHTRAYWLHLLSLFSLLL